MADEPRSADPTAPVVIFDYIKGGQFRPIRADGAIGAITPNGHIHMALYSERFAIPRRTVIEIEGDGTLGAIREMETRQSVIREMEVDIFLDVNAAKLIHDWLGDRIKEAQKREDPNGERG